MQFNFTSALGIQNFVNIQFNFISHITIYFFFSNITFNTETNNITECKSIKGKKKTFKLEIHRTFHEFHSKL